MRLWCMPRFHINASSLLEWMYIFLLVFSSLLLLLHFVLSFILISNVRLLKLFEFSKAHLPSAYVYNNELFVHNFLFSSLVWINIRHTASITLFFFQNFSLAFLSKERKSDSRLWKEGMSSFYLRKLSSQREFRTIVYNCSIDKKLGWKRKTYTQKKNIRNYGWKTQTWNDA